MYLKQRFFLFAIPFLLLSCEETNNTTFSKLPSFNLNQDSSTNQQESHVEKIYFNVPSTMKTAYILKKAGATYDASFPLNPNKANDDFTTEQQALLLGIYGSDLNYTIVSNKNQETINYLNSINSLGEKLGLGNILNQEMKNRIEKNVNSKDSMQVIITDLFWKIEQSLNEDGRSRIGALIVTGGWIEGLYVATQIAIKMPENIKIKSIICQQKFSSKDVLELVKNSCSSEYISDVVLRPLKQINASLSKIKTRQEFYSSELNVDENDMIIDNNVINEITTIIEQIRDDITH